MPNPFLVQKAAECGTLLKKDFGDLVHMGLVF